MAMAAVAGRAGGAHHVDERRLADVRAPDEGDLGQRRGRQRLERDPSLDKVDTMHQRVDERLIRLGVGAHAARRHRVEGAVHAVEPPRLPERAEQPRARAELGRRAARRRRLHPCDERDRLLAVAGLQPLERERRHARRRHRLPQRLLAVGGGGRHAVGGRRRDLIELREERRRIVEALAAAEREEERARRAHVGRRRPAVPPEELEREAVAPHPQQRARHRRVRRRELVGRRGVVEVERLPRHPQFGALGGARLDRAGGRRGDRLERCRGRSDVGSGGAAALAPECAAAARIAHDDGNCG